MDLVPIAGPVTAGKHVHTDQHQQKGFNKHQGHHAGDFLKRFWVCVFLTIPVLLLSHVVQQWLGLQHSFRGDRFVLLGLGTLIYIYGGMPFLKGMTGELKAKAPGMMTLIAVAISVAYSYSVAVVFGLKGMDFFWELVTLIDIMLLGHWLEMRSELSASRALHSLVALLPNSVTISRDGVAETISLDQLKNGDVILIRPGEKIPADGIITEGSSFINESLLTGESVPVKKEMQDRVIAGSINGDGALHVKATGVGKDTYINKVIDLVQEAQVAKSKTQNLADKVARWLTLIAIGVGLLTFIYWYTGSGDIAFALERMVTVMVTTCPHALGVAIPLVVAISTARSATSGLLIRNRTAFENTRRLSTVIFDKTGTLTKGSHAVEKIIPLSPEYTADDIIQYAAAVQQYSEHYIARGILNYSKAKNLEQWQSRDFRYIQGMGVKGLVLGKQVVVAGPNYFKENGIAIPEIPAAIHQDTQTVSFVLIDGEAAGIIALADSLREGAQQAIRDLKNMNIRSFLLTGDNEKVAAAVAATLGMDGYLANVLPHQKQEKIKEFQAGGAIVAMTGDGVNDAPALARADVGIAIGSGTDVAAETADIILVNSEPRDVATLISFGKRTYNKMIQNISWAVGYNVVAIPLAAGVLYPQFVLSPAMGAVLMSASTIIVAINASLLKLKSH
ncbi:MAG: copper-translocating P-type ATPase [Chitinophagaceae bacterium]|nr:copper-translocating P-type ATPase [Chitinophagaceae bacterium]